jgi:hypothetical protein
MHQLRLARKITKTEERGSYGQAMHGRAGDILDWLVALRIFLLSDIEACGRGGDCPMLSCLVSSAIDETTTTSSAPLLPLQTPATRHCPIRLPRLRDPTLYPLLQKHYHHILDCA